MAVSILRIHEELFKFLLTEFEMRRLMFTLRKSNRANKLEQGYWFYGNEEYLAVSFWSGMDWKNRTPNIFFVVTADGRSYLDISVSDSDIKRAFVEEHLIGEQNPLRISNDKRYIKSYDEFGLDFIRSLRSFLKNDKIYIDECISAVPDYFPEGEKSSIGMIQENDFIDTLQKVYRYRFTANVDMMRDMEREITLKGFHIRNFGPIQDTTFIPLKSDCQWVFLTGENGTGKTSLLKAIAGGLCHMKMEGAEQSFFHFSFNGTEEDYYRSGNEDTRKLRPIIGGMCVYGAARLKNSSINPRNFSITRSLNKKGVLSSLFDSDTVLIDIQDQLNIWQRDERMRDMYFKRTDYIREVLVDLLPNIVDVRFSEKNSYSLTEYIEADRDGRFFEPVTFAKLASGLKSLVAMIGDMMMRLFNQQPHINDPSELSGLVIIDEIDIHLHPNLQKILVEQLTKTFPRVKFFASTHSPIPLLGAPLNSQFLKIERNGRFGVEIADLSTISVSELLPNALLSSELFGMDRLFTRENSDVSQIRTENSYQEILINDRVKENLRRVASNLKNNNEEGK